MIPYNYPLTKYCYNKKKREKLLKAVVYDFLKKNRALGVYFDSYATYRGITSEFIASIATKNKPILATFLESAIARMELGGEALSEFFFSGNISFSWRALNEGQRKKIVSLDKKWTNLLSNLRDLR